MTWIDAPLELQELERRARALAGRPLDELALELGIATLDIGLHAKGKAGTLIERALGASAGSAPLPDFPQLGVELKTIPVTPDGTPRESTFVCTISLADADRAEWDTSRARAKLRHVLWVPIVVEPEVRTRRIGLPVFWRPTASQEAVLRADFEDLMGIIGVGGIEALTARQGTWLQIRPKAASGRVRTRAFGPEGELIASVPRGFYLRASFTGAILRNPAAEP